MRTYCQHLPSLKPQMPITHITPSTGWPCGGPVGEQAGQSVIDFRWPCPNWLCVRRIPTTPTLLLGILVYPQVKRSHAGKCWRSPTHTNIHLHEHSRTHSHIYAFAQRLASPSRLASGKASANGRREPLDFEEGAYCFGGVSFVWSKVIHSDV